MEIEGLGSAWESFLGGLTALETALTRLPQDHPTNPILHAQLAALRAVVAPYTLSINPAILQGLSVPPLSPLARTQLASTSQHLPQRPSSYADALAVQASQAALSLSLSTKQTPSAAPPIKLTGSNQIPLGSSNSIPSPPLIDKYASQIVLSVHALPDSSSLRKATKEQKETLIRLSFARVPVRLSGWVTLSDSGDLVLKFYSPYDASIARNHSNTWLPILDPSHTLQISTPHRTHAILVHRVPKATPQEDFIEMLEDAAGGVIKKGDKLPGRREDAMFGSRKVLFEEADSAKRCVAMEKMLMWGAEVWFERWDPEKVISQCFKCARWGHRATSCTAKKETCRRCGKEHSSQECQEAAVFCVNCKQNIPSWHSDCPSKKNLIRTPLPLPISKHAFRAPHIEVEARNLSRTNINQVDETQSLASPVADQVNQVALATPEGHGKEHVDETPQASADVSPRRRHSISVIEHPVSTPAPSAPRKLSTVLHMTRSKSRIPTLNLSSTSSSTENLPGQSSTLVDI